MATDITPADVKWFCGQSPRVSWDDDAALWRKGGFTCTDLERWASVGVTSPHVAAMLRDSGVGPESLTKWEPMTRAEATSLRSSDVTFVVRVAATGAIGVAIDYDFDSMVVVVATPKSYVISHDIMITGHAPADLEVQRS